MPAPTTGAVRSSASRYTTTPLGPAADAAMNEAFEQLAEAREESRVLRIEQRELQARRKAGGVVWFDFRDLVRRPAIAE